jgi:hypothetical protein
MQAKIKTSKCNNREILASHNRWTLKTEVLRSSEMNLTARLHNPEDLHVKSNDTLTRNPVIWRTRDLRLLT